MRGKDVFYGGFESGYERGGRLLDVGDMINNG